MRKLLLKAFMVVVACCLYPTFALSETISPNAGEVVVMPTNPTSTDSIRLVYYYTSTDGCPDYNLALDSVVTNKVYVSRKKIDNGDRMCTTVITKFKSIINLGLLKANSLIYFDGKLVKTITPPCVMNKTGIVVAGTNECLGRLFIEDTSSPVMSPLPQLYAFENNVIVNGTSTSKLKVGDKVKFGSNSILNDNTSTCKIVGIANCFEIIQVTPPPPPPCVMDKTGIVVYGDNECATKIFIQEYSPISSAKQLYLIENNGVTNGITNTSLKVGNKVKFGGYLIKADSAKIYGCGIVGIAKCWAITETPPPCVMDKTGLVFEIKDNMSLIKVSNTSTDIYAIQGAKFAVGTKIQFKGVKVECVTTPCYNKVECFKVIETPPACVMDKTGLVFEIKDNMCLIKESNTSTEIYAIPGAKFAIGTKIQFKGVKIECITTPCYNKVECFKVIETPPTCIMDKKGVVFEIKDNMALIRESNTSTDIYAIKDARFPVGTVIQFKGLKINCITTPCYNTVECYKVVETPPCVMDKKGTVIEIKENLTIIKESTSADLYAIKNVKFAIGTVIQFKGVKVECVTTPCYNNVECYKIVDVVSPCKIDKYGIVVSGENDCAGKLFIQEISAISSAKQLYLIEKNLMPNGIEAANLKLGTKVKFGGYLIKADSTKLYSCGIVGIATCYAVSEVPVTCTMDKNGVVVPGIDGCTGRLFISENTNDGSIKLYSVKSNFVNTDGASTLVLKAGDKVKFGANPNANEGSSILCPTAGVATCYQVLASENSYSLSGKVMAGVDLLKNGITYLFKKGDTKASATNKISNGYFKFYNLPAGEYTVYVVPSFDGNKSFMPTFYPNKFSFAEAEYVKLSTNVLDLVVTLNKYDLPKGAGRITGKLLYENGALKDSVIATNGLESPLKENSSDLASFTPITLVNDFNEPVAWAISDFDGNFAFESIPLDSYLVSSETASAKGASLAILNSSTTEINTNVVLRSPENATSLNNNKASVLSIYPNPASSKVVITLKESGQIQIFNAIGQVVLSKSLKEGRNTLDVSSLDKGVCFLKIGNSTYKLFKE